MRKHVFLPKRETKQHGFSICSGAATSNLKNKVTTTGCYKEMLISVFAMFCTSYLHCCIIASFNHFFVEHLEDLNEGSYSLKGQYHENHFENSRVQKHIYSNGNLQQVVHFRKNDNASVMKLKKEVISLR